MRHHRVMRSVVGAALFALVIGAWFFSPLAVIAQETPNTSDARAEQAAQLAWPGEYIVALDPAVREVSAAQAQLATIGELVDQVTVCGSGTVLQVWRMQDAGAPQTFQALSENPAVRYVEPNWIVRAADMPTPPPATPELPFTFDDTYYASRQWPLQRSNFARAWQLVQENDLISQTVRVAVIDSGVDFDHPDLEGRLLNGVNYITPTLKAVDDFGHGTHVAGIIAALANNGLGIVGGAPEVQIDPVKMLRSDGGGTITNLISAICDAADRGADVINMSLEVPTTLDLAVAGEMQAAVNYAYNKGSLLVAAAGNSSGGPVYYPARLNHVMAVAALTPENTRASYSARGTQLDIAAGGGSFTQSVLSTWPTGVIGNCTGSGRVLLWDNGAYYCTEPGTSMAAPLVSAAGALLLSVQPDLTNDDVEAILEETAIDIGLLPIEVGAGLLNTEAAVRRILTSNAAASPSVVGGMVLPGTDPFTQTVIVDSQSLDPLDISGVASPAAWLEVVNLGGSSFATSIIHGEPLYLSFAISPTNLITGVYASTVTLDMSRSDGSRSTLSLPIRVGVANLNAQTYLPMIFSESQQPAPPSPVTAEYTWESPVLTPTVLAPDSSGWMTVSLPFAFPLSGADPKSAVSYSQAYVNENGFLVFAASNLDPLATPDENRCLPLLDQAVQGIFGWWADLDLAAPGGEISTFMPAADRFVIQYENIASAPRVTPSYTVTFQIVLYQNGAIGLNYADAPDVLATDLSGLTPQVTVGVQARSGLFHNQVACVTPTAGYGRPPHAEQSVLIERGDVY